MQMIWCFSNLQVEHWLFWFHSCMMITLWSHLFMVAQVVGGLFTGAKHQLTCLKLNFLFSTNCSLSSSLPWSANDNLIFSMTQAQSFSYFWRLIPLYLKSSKWEVSKTMAWGPNWACCLFLYGPRAKNFFFNILKWLKSENSLWHFIKIIWSSNLSVDKVLLEHIHTYLSPVAAFMLPQSWVFATKIICPPKPKILTFWPFNRKGLLTPTINQ